MSQETGDTERESERRRFVGQFVPWDGGCLLAGRGGGLVPLHAHYALQIAFGAQPGIRFRTDERDPWTTYDGAMIPSRQPHAMDATGIGTTVVVFVEPETREGRAITARHLAHGLAAMPADIVATEGAALAAAWESAWDERGGGDAVLDAARRLVRALAGGVPLGAAPDERILRAVAFVKANLDRALTLDEVAGEACLSPSRFRHLFVEETGMGLRQYVLWRRFLRVWELLMAGESLSAAAHAAGFADAAHLSRTSRSMFGMPPSAMQMQGPRQVPPVAPGVPRTVSASPSRDAHAADARR